MRIELSDYKKNMVKIALFINLILLLTKDVSADTLVGIHQDDPQLIKVIQDKYFDFH